MVHICFSCGDKLPVAADSRVGRRDSCPSCNADMHVCRNCVHYDRNSYNDCREPQAERVLDKERSNFCDYFSFADNRAAVAGSQGRESKQEAHKKLDDLFK